MTVAELFALPVGARVRWEPDYGGEVFGQVVGRDGADVHILWDDGQDCYAFEDDDGLDTFADQLELLTNPLADQPYIVRGDG